MLARTYWDAFEINQEIYIINPRNGMIQCITSETPKGEELEKISNAITECRERRKKKTEKKGEEIEEAYECIKKLSETSIHVLIKE